MRILYYICQKTLYITCVLQIIGDCNMSSEVVNFRTTPELIRQMQKIVDSGYYRNRTEAMNDAIRLLVRRYMAVRVRQKIFKTRRKLGKYKGDLTGALITTRNEEW